MKAKVYDINGKNIKEIELPPQFEEEIRPDLIRRAFIALQTHKIQPKGVDVLAGKRHVVWWHKRRRKRFRTFYEWGISRAPRKIFARIGGGWRRIIYKAAFAPYTVGGREAHPPTIMKKIWEKINKKERRKAIRSAIAATVSKYFVKKRGHVFDGELPIIVENKIKDIKKTKEAKELVKKLGLDRDLERASVKKVRSGKGKMRGRKYKKRKSFLVVFDENCPAMKAFKNLPGVDVALVKDLNVELLAPGGEPARLVIWSEGAIEKLKNDKLFL